ncbi:MAG: tRNA 4-thiouridine(8) synthase ThiI [Oscillospiraceae bacterium]|jgi:thiamine biosynthesis protein ThiI|nr:tRNA 4-thiouridine(8) synthase ThiI [Oscillospiraceae bacterium]
MREILLVRFGEVHLKGQNRPQFLRALVDQVRRAARPFGGHVWLHDSRIYVSDMNDTTACAQKVAQVFGIQSVSIATEMDKADPEAVYAQAAQMMQGKTGSFKVKARRSDKRYPADSLEMNAAAGERILRENPHLTVDVHKPDHTLEIEIREAATLHIGRIEGAGGMPMGTNGKACLLLSGGIDSPVAGYMVARRGVRLMAVHFHSFPYTSERARDKVIELARILSESCGRIDLYIASFTDIQTQIHQHCPEAYGTLLMRRQMMRIAEIIARREGAQAMITGESMGQVASQTMEALGCTDAVCTLPVFRPLIGFDKSDIIAWAEKIHTFETSSLPYEDCCTVFTPRHPVTHPKIDRVIEAEAPIAEALPGWIEQAAAEAEHVILEGTPLG